MTEATEGNPFGIDPGKIGYLGEGTGGYVSYADLPSATTMTSFSMTMERLLPSSGQAHRDSLTTFQW